MSVNRKAIATAAAAVVAVGGIGFGAGAGWHRATTDPVVETVTVAAPVARLSDTLCVSNAVVTVDGIDYEISYQNHGVRGVRLIPVEKNRRTIDAGVCDGMSKGRAQNFPAWDHHTGGCVMTTWIDARRFIVSAGWGMIVPEPGRLASPGETPRDACKTVVPPIEDVQGYAVDDENGACGEDGLYVRALRACLSRDQLAPGENGRMRLK